MRYQLKLFIFLFSMISGFTALGLPFSSHAAGPNLIQNPGLEQADAADPAKPEGWSSNFWGSVQAEFEYPVLGLNGSNAAKVRVTSAGIDGDAKWYFEDVDVSGGQTYVYSTNYIADVESEIDIRYTMSDGSYVYDYVSMLPLSASWSTVSYEITSPAGAVSATIFHLINKPGALTIDDVSFAVKTESPPPPTGESMILNHGFEYADGNLPSSWTKNGWGDNIAQLIYPVSGYNGGSAARVEISSYISGDAKWTHTPVAVNPGQAYELELAYRSNVNSEITLQYRLDDGTYSYIWIATLPPSSDWAHSQKFTFTAPEDASEITVFHLISQNGWLESDDMILLESSSPPPQDPDNMISNGNMNTSGLDKPTLWEGSSWGDISADFNYPIENSIDGTNASRVDVYYYGSGDAKWVHEPVAITPNANYSFSLDYRSNVNTVLTIRYKLSDGSYQYAWLNAPAVSESWTTESYSFTAPANATEATVFHLISAVGWLEIDNFKLQEQSSVSFGEPMVTLVFDDGFQNIYDNALPILTAAGIKSTQAIVSDAVTYDGYMGIAEVLEFEAAGHEIASHTKTHAHLTQLDDGGLYDKIIQSRLDLLSYGVGSVDTFVYPYGEYNDRVTQYIADSGYYIAARTVDEGFNYTNSDPFLLMDQHVEVDTPLWKITSAIDTAIANNSWVILEFHAIDYSGNQYSATPEMLQSIVDFIQYTGIQTVTLKEGALRLNN